MVNRRQAPMPENCMLSPEQLQRLRTQFYAFNKLVKTLALPPDVQRQCFPCQKEPGCPCGACERSDERNQMPLGKTTHARQPSGEVHNHQHRPSNRKDSWIRWSRKRDHDSEGIDMEKMWYIPSVAFVDPGFATLDPFGERERSRSRKGRKFADPLSPGSLPQAAAPQSSGSEGSESELADWVCVADVKSATHQQPTVPLLEQIPKSADHLEAPCAWIPPDLLHISALAPTTRESRSLP